MPKSKPCSTNVSTDVPGGPGNQVRASADPTTKIAGRRAGGKYLTRTSAGWRFQMRLPSRFLCCQTYPYTTHVRLRLGSMPAARARALADAMATICRTVMEHAEMEMAKKVDEDWLPKTPEGNLVERVVAACEAGLAEAKRAKDGSIAVGFASGLQNALATLTYVHGEAMNPNGNPAVRAHANTIVNDTLRNILASNGDAKPFPGGIRLLDPAEEPPAILAAAPFPAWPEPARAALFSEAARDYIAMREDAAGGASKLSGKSSLELRCRTFVEVIGDKPYTDYARGDLQRYVSQMQTWPANVTKRGLWSDLSVPKILERNKDLTERPLAKKSMEDGYVATIKTVMRWAAERDERRSPFDRVKIRWPDILRPSVPREPISNRVLSAAFARAVEADEIENALLLLLPYVTGRRIGLLVYLQGGDLREKDGVWIAQTNGIVATETGFKRVPYKTDDSVQFFVLHRKLAEIGFCEWAKAQHGFVFGEIHKLADASKSASQNLNRLLRAAGAAGGNREVLHSLRGGRIDENRDAVSGRANRLQAGHELSDVHDRDYGTKALRPKDMKALYNLRVPKDVDLSPFDRINFDALKLKERTPRRRKKR